MGAGVALALVRKWPTIIKADKSTKRGDPNKLGTYSQACVTYHKDWSRRKYVLNMYTQYDTGTDYRRVDYEAIARGFEKLNEQHLKAKNKLGFPFTYAIPMIGAGLAGGNWSIIKTIIEETTPNIPIIKVYQL